MTLIQLKVGNMLQELCGSSEQLSVCFHPMNQGVSFCKEVGLNAFKRVTDQEHFDVSS